MMDDLFPTSKKQIGLGSNAGSIGSTYIVLLREPNMLVGNQRVKRIYHL
jgi:hypothetical protein